MFEILLCGGRDSNSNKVVGTVRQCYVNSFKSIEYLPSMIPTRRYSEAICVDEDLYVFGGLDDIYNCTISAEKFSPLIMTWNKVADMYDERDGFCACMFIEKVFVIGGMVDGTASDSCLQFDTKDYSWEEVVGMKEARIRAACTVFEGIIVVGGGYNINIGDLNSVESYDVAEITWTAMTNMIEQRFGDSLVSVKNKLFVLGGNNDGTCEVFESSSNKFVVLKSPPLFNCNNAFSIGTKIYIF